MGSAPQGMRQAPGGTAVLGVEDDRVDADGPAPLCVREANSEERALHGRLLLLPGESPVAAREDDPELPGDPGVIRIAVADAVEIDVAGLDAGIEGALGKLDVLGDAARGPRGAAVLGVDHRAEVARRVAALRRGKRHGEDVSVGAGVQQRPGRAAVLRDVDDPFLPGNPGGLGVEAADGEEGSLRLRVLPLPRGATVVRAEDAAELSDHPALLVGGKAGGKEVLADLPEMDRLGAGARRARDHERGDNELHAELHRSWRGVLRAVQTVGLYRTVSFRPLPAHGPKCQRPPASGSTGRATCAPSASERGVGTRRALPSGARCGRDGGWGVSARGARGRAPASGEWGPAGLCPAGRGAEPLAMNQNTYSTWKRTLSLSRTVPNCCAATEVTDV